MANSKKTLKPGRSKQFDTMLRIPMTQEMANALRERAYADDIYPTTIVRRLVNDWLAQEAAQ